MNKTELKRKKEFVLIDNLINKYLDIFLENGDDLYFQFDGVKFSSLKEIKSFIIDIINLQLKNIKKKFDIETKIAYDIQNFVENHRKLN